MRDRDLIAAEIDLARRDLGHRLAALRARVSSTVAKGRKVKDAVVPTLAAIAAIGVLAVVFVVVRRRRHHNLLTS